MDICAIGLDCCHMHDKNKYWLFDCSHVGECLACEIDSLNSVILPFSCCGIVVDSRMPRRYKSGEEWSCTTALVIANACLPFYCNCDGEW